MKIRTSYFGNHRIPSSFVKVSISRFPPENFGGMQYLKLAPPPELLRQVKQSKDHETYTKLYKQLVFDHLTKEEVLQDLEKISTICGGKDIILLCFERPTDFCHRHLVAEFLGPDVQEYQNEQEDETPLNSLF